MFEVIPILKDENQKYQQLIQSLGDPFILDITQSRDAYLASIYKRDYLNMWYFKNKGITKVFLRNPSKAKGRVKNLSSKLRLFSRELVVLYDKIEHYQVVRNLIY